MHLHMNRVLLNAGAFVQQAISFVQIFVTKSWQVTMTSKESTDVTLALVDTSLLSMLMLSNFHIQSRTPGALRQVFLQMRRNQLTSVLRLSLAPSRSAS